MDLSNRPIAGSLTASVIAQGGLSVAPLATPINAAFDLVQTSTTGIGAGTYFYRVSATNDFGETLASAETSITVPGGPAIWGIVIKWGAVLGATGYRVYGRTSGAQQFLYAVVGGGNCAILESNHSLVPSGALPTANTTGRAIVNGVDLVSPAASTLYVATTGLDTNNGLTASTPLLTLTAALKKCSFLIQPGHAVVINMAAGTYDEHCIAPAFILQDNITVTGAPMVLTAPGTGISSGTFDVAFGTQAFPHRALVTGAGWTTGGLTGGFFVEMTSGANLGAQYPVVNNGVDTIDLAFPCNTGTLDLQGQTFQLVKPTTILTRNAQETVFDALAPILGQTTTALPVVLPSLAAYLVFSKIAFQRTAAFSGQGLLRVSGGAYVRCNNCSFLDAGSGGGSMVSAVAQSVLRLDDCLTHRAALRTNTLHISVNFSNLIANRYGSHGGNFAFSSVTSSSVTVSSGFFYGHDVAAACGSDTRAQLTSVGIDAPFGGAQVTDWGVLILSRCTIKNCLTWGVAAGFQGFGGSFGTSAVSGGTIVLTGFSGVGTVIDNCVLGVILGANCDCNLVIQSAINNCATAGVNMAATLRSAHNVAVVNPLFAMAGNAVDFLVDGATPNTLAFLRAQVPKVITSVNFFNKLVEV